MTRRNRRILSRIVTLVIIVLCLYFVVQTVRMAKSAEKQFGLTPLSLYQLMTDGEAMMKSTDGRVNILLLGMGGENHDGPDLTDTIIVLSLSLTQKTLALISIPRDIWSDTLKDKINSAYHYGEEKKKDGGLTLSAVVVEDVIGMPIHYTIAIDFTQFETLIDYIGGIDVTVPIAFTDNEYPIAGKENDDCSGDVRYACRYQTISFQKGVQHMDGTRALMYVRSRHAEGEEGSDFARSKRQQEVILAVKNKILQLAPWYHPELSIQLYRSFDKATKTDLTIGQLLALAKIGTSLKEESIKKISIEQKLSEMPIETYNRYALTPTVSWEEIYLYITSSLN